MEEAVNVVTYFAKRYQAEYGEQISELKMQNLVYLAQREAYIKTGHPMFKATFYAWRYGPILKEIRNAYQQDTIPKIAQRKSVCGERAEAILDIVYRNCAAQKSWDLSRVTCSDIAWKNAREGIHPKQGRGRPMVEEDFLSDARRIRLRRAKLGETGFSWNRNLSGLKRKPTPRIKN